jgi:hypothetical protein
MQEGLGQCDYFGAYFATLLEYSMGNCSEEQWIGMIRCLF